MQSTHVRLESEILDVLRAFAKRTGKSQTYVLAEALLEYMAYREDAAAVRLILERHARNKVLVEWWKNTFREIKEAREHATQSKG